MTLPEGYKVLREEERIGRMGQLYTVQVVGEAEQQDAHVHAFDLATRSSGWKRRDAERRLEAIARREAMKPRKLAKAARPEWHKAARELKALGFTVSRMAEIFGVTEYAVKKWARNERLIKGEK